MAVRATFVVSVATAVAPRTALPDRSVTTPTSVKVRIVGAGAGVAAGGAVGCVKVAVLDVELERPLSSAYPTATAIEVMVLVAPAASSILIVPDDTDAPAAMRIGVVGFASADPPPRVNRIVLTVAAARPLVSVIVNDVRYVRPAPRT